MLKKKHFLPVLVLAAVMLAAVAVTTWVQSGDLLGQVRFIDGVRRQELALHYDASSGGYVLFLPGYASAGDVAAECPKGFSVQYDGNDTLDGAALAQTIELTVHAPFRTQKASLRLESVGDLPAIFVEAEEGLLDFLNADKSNTRDVAVRVMDGNGNVQLQATASMYGRGNGSWDSPSKKPYNLEFSQPITVGPFEDITKLALLAEFSDESKLRNSLAYFAGQELGVDYASAYQYANLYVSGEYLGLYGMVTKQEYMKHLETDNIQAVFEMASGHNRVEFDSDLGWRINVMYGSKAQVQTLVQTLEAALTQGDWQTIENLIDVESFARKYALEEFLANLDLSYASQYFYVSGDGKLRCMLPWDYDWTLGSSYNYFNNRQVCELKVLRNTASWYNLLLENASFRLAAADALEKRFDDAYLQKLEAHLTEAAGEIGPAWHSDMLRWENELPYNVYDLSSGITTLEGFCDAFRSYFYDRRDLLIDYFRNPENYCQVSFAGTRWGNLMLPRGTDLGSWLEGATILEVQVPGEEFLGWHDLDGEQADMNIVLEEDVMFITQYVEQESETTAQSWLETHIWKLVLYMAFGAAALALVRMEWKRHWAHREGR